MWRWFDEILFELPVDDEVPVGQRYAWWEDMVAYLIETEGFVSLT